MKLLVFLSLCAIATGTWRDWGEIHHEEIGEQYYRTQREYRYLYRGQLSTGLPQESDLHVSNRIEAVFSLVFPSSEKSGIFKIRNIKIGSRNDELPDPREVQPFEAFDEKEIGEAHHKALLSPLRFRYVDGLITEIEFDRDDMSWSENIKRAILNLLQVNMKKNARTDKREDADRWEETEDHEMGHENVDFFTVHERTLEGDCDTTYTFMKSARGAQKQDIMRITKSINYNKCTKRVDLRYNHRFAHHCAKCQLNYDIENGLMPSTVISYEVLGSRDRFLIKNVDIKSNYVLAPLSPKDLVMETYSTATLQLLKVIENVRDIEEPRNSHKDTLMYVPERVYRIERFIMNGDEELDSKHVYAQVKHKYELAEQMIRRLIRATSNSELGVEPEAAHQLARLEDLFRSYSSSDFETLSHELFEDTGKFDKKTQQKVRDILFDAMSLVGTYNTMQQVIEKIEKRQVSDLKAAKGLHNLMLNTIVMSEKQIDMILELCEKDVCERNPILKQACLLTAGGMISALCTPNNDFHAVDLVHERCPRQIKEKYHREMIEIYRNANSRYEKILALRTIGNAGIDLTVYDLEKIITDRREERVIRVQAIDALRHLRCVMPRKIQKILLPIFKDRTEHPEIRIAALAQVMHTLPERSIIDQIAQILFHETSRQVQTFTYTMMKEFAKSENPYEKRLAEDLQVSLRLSPAQTTRWSESKFMHRTKYSENHKAGITLDLATIFANDSTLPRESILSFDTVQFGQWRKATAQMGFIQYNIEHIIERWIRGPEHEKTRAARTSSHSPIQLLRALSENLGIRSRRGRSEAHAMLYMRRFGMDFALLPMDAETIPELFANERDEKIDLGRFLDRFARGYKFSTYFAHYMHETYHKIPTTVGIPLHYSSKMPMVAGIEGELKVTLEPNDPEDLRSLKLQINARPTFAATHLIETYSINPITNQRPKMLQAIKMNVPIDARVEINFGRKTEMKVIMKVPEEKKQILLIQTRFITSAGDPRNSKTYVEPLEMTAHLRNQNERLATPAKTFGEKWMGVRMHVRGQWHQNPLKFLMQSPMALLAAENELEITIEKGRDAPREIVAKFEFEQLKQHRMERPQLQEFYSDDKYERKLFDIKRERESDEEDEEHGSHQRYDSEQRERYEQFARYVREYEPENGHKLRVQMEIEAVGSSSERKAEVEIHTGCDEKVRYCRIDVEARRTPIFDDERRDWTLKAKLESLYPEVVRSLKELNEKKHRLLNAQAECEWGSEQKQHINLKIQGGQSREQARLVESMNTDLTPVQRHEDFLLATQLNEYKVVANYKVNQCFKDCFNRMFDLLKSWHMWGAQIQQVQNPEDKMFAKLTIHPHNHELLSVAVETSKELVEIKDIALPIKIAPFVMKVRTPAHSFTELIRKAISDDRAECTVSSSRVNTFDDVNIKMPLTTCYSLLAKDCRSRQPTFAVLMRKLRKNSQEKKMKIIDEDHVIELEPIRGELEVRIDGREVEDDERLSEMGIEKKADMVIVELGDVNVRFDGQIALVKVSPIFKNGQCGICGHYDGEKLDELRAADNGLTDDVEEYSRSYFDKGDECNIEEDIVSEKNSYRFDDDIDENFDIDDVEEEEEREIKKPILRTKIIEHNYEVCFSMKAVPHCPHKTYARNEMKTRKKVPFVCLPRTNHEATNFINRALHEVLDVNDYKKSFVEEVTVPDSCRAF
ncbi:Vitellogenin-6 [Toxocara canis]|uniref:Vitellogenin-6 n=1 Tax=Toxocara canis TaxID=6265 RepID=A0A0B2V8F3_TOXCA|nr:Vitellogenin-6 [Toxocara canis]